MPPRKKQKTESPALPIVTTISSDSDVEMLALAFDLLCCTAHASPYARVRQEPVAGPSKLAATSAPQQSASLTGEAGFRADLAALKAVFGGAGHAVKGGLNSAFLGSCIDLRSGVGNGDSEHSVVFKVPNPANKKRNILFVLASDWVKSLIRLWLREQIQRDGLASKRLWSITRFHCLG